MFFLLESHFEVLCCSLHGLHKPPSLNTESAHHTASRLKGLFLHAGSHDGELLHHHFHQFPRCHHRAFLWFSDSTRDFQFNMKWDTKPMQWLALQTKCSAFYNSPDDHRKHSALQDLSAKWSINRWHSSNVCISIKPALFLPVLWTCSAAQLPQQNCLDKSEGDSWKQLTGVKTTTKQVLSCASTNLTAGQRPWRITLGSRTCGWKRHSSPLWWQGQTSPREMSRGTLKLKSCLSSFLATAGLPGRRLSAFLDCALICVNIPILRRYPINPQFRLTADGHSLLFNTFTLSHINTMSSPLDFWREKLFCIPIKNSNFPP